MYKTCIQYVIKYIVSYNYVDVFLSQYVLKSMVSYNPAYIPRNHRIEEVIKYALKGDLSYFHKFCMILANPFEEQSVNKDYLLPPRPDEVVSQTFCGT